jgi:hypothetical protein
MTVPSPNLDVNSELGKKIVAVTTFGNTRHTANQPYNQFSGAPDNGLFPRPAYQLANLATWTAKYHDYCVAEDPICAGGNVVADHLNYFDLYSDTAAAWVKSQIAAADVVVSSTIVSPSSTFTSVATTDKVVPTTYAYSNNTASAPVITGSASLSSIQSAVLAIPTVAPESVVTVTVDCASVDTSAIASYTSVWAATAQVTQSVAASTTAGSSSGAAATTGAAGSKTSSASNGTHTLMPYTGAASSISGAVSGSLAVVLLGAFALVL